jgi:hypothetical protein
MSRGERGEGVEMAEGVAVPLFGAEEDVRGIDAFVEVLDRDAAGVGEAEEGGVGLGAGGVV